MEIKAVEFVTSLPRYASFQGEGLPQIAFAGRSNVGKSSLINKLCRQPKLARTSGTPGKTQLINIFLVNQRFELPFHLVDLPGYGYAKVDKAKKADWGSMMDSYFDKSPNIAAVAHLVDIRHEPTGDDVQMNAFLRARGIPFFVMATKADKISRGARMQAIAAICRSLSVQPWQVTAFSAEDGTGREELLSRIERALSCEEPSAMV